MSPMARENLDVLVRNLTSVGTPCNQFSPILLSAVEYGHLFRTHQDFPGKPWHSEAKGYKYFSC